MFTVITIMFGGIAIGYLFRKINWLQKVTRIIPFTILLLLFMLGITVGANETIIRNLFTLGWQAFLLAIAGTLGSVIVAWIVYQYFFKESKQT